MIKVRFTNFHDENVCEAILENNEIKYSGRLADYVKGILEDEKFYYSDGKEKHHLSIENPKELMLNLYNVITGTNLRASKPIVGRFIT